MSSPMAPRLTAALIDRYRLERELGQGGMATFSPDGASLGFQQNNKLRKVSLSGGAVTTIRDDGATSAAWGPDDVIYFTSPAGLHRVSAAGGNPELITPADSATRESYRWPDALPDGSAQVTRNQRNLVFREGSVAARRNIWMASLDSARTQRPLLRTPFDEKNLALSPDGQWLAYVSDEAGTEEIYVRRLEEGSGRWRVSKSGGEEPRWGPGGRELFYRSADSILSVGMEAGAEPRFTDSRLVLTGEFNSDRNRPVWDVSPDGRRFVFTRSQGESTGRSLNIVLHWFDQLRAR